MKNFTTLRSKFMNYEEINFTFSDCSRDDWR